MNSRGLNTDPWCTPTLTSNSSLKELFTRVLLLVTNHSATPTTQRTLHSTLAKRTLGHFSEGLFEIGKCHIQFPMFCKILFLKLSKNKNCICCVSTGAEPKLRFINVNCLTYDVIDRSFNNL